MRLTKRQERAMERYILATLRRFAREAGIVEPAGYRLHHPIAGRCLSLYERPKRGV